MTMGSSANEATFRISCESALSEGYPAESILYDYSQLPRSRMTDREISHECTDHIISKGNEVMVTRSDKGVRWGNPGGLSMLERLDKMEVTLGEQGTTIVNQGTTVREQGALIQQQGARIKSLESDGEVTQAELKDLKAVDDTYLNIRSRWFSNYIKNKRPDKRTTEDEFIINAGDEAAHHGDAWSDALMFKRKIRTDVSIYKDLYGVSPQQVLNHLSSEDHDTQSVRKALSKHATMKADTKYWVPDSTFFRAFTDFVDALESANFNINQIFLDSAPERTLLSAYWAKLEAVPPKMKTKGGKKQ